MPTKDSIRIMSLITSLYLVSTVLGVAFGADFVRTMHNFDVSNLQTVLEHVDQNERCDLVLYEGIMELGMRYLNRPKYIIRNDSSDFWMKIKKKQCVLEVGVDLVNRILPSGLNIVLSHLNSNGGLTPTEVYSTRRTLYFRTCSGSPHWELLDVSSAWPKCPNQLEGRNLTVAFSGVPPFITDGSVHKAAKHKDVRGVDPEILMILAQKFRFAFSLSNRRIGYFDKEELKWKGKVGLVSEILLNTAKHGNVEL